MCGFRPGLTREGFPITDWTMINHQVTNSAYGDRSDV
jgi:hypothetical protein